jgi:phosphoribosyl-ATP pyrophosphohydrolase/phosphoribosyl-AMP cyclohydrolase
MITKKFIPCIYLYQKQAVRGLNDTTVVCKEPLELVKQYNENNADELIVFDMSSGDTEHEDALDVMKDICALAEMDVIGAGNVKRMEDIKKILYTGCKKAALNYEKQSNIDLTIEL